MNTTNLLANGEVSLERRLLAVRMSKKNKQEGPSAAPVSSAALGCHGVVEDGMVGKWCEVSRESPAGAELVFMVQRDPKSRRRRAVRASIVASKRGNARGAKGRRKMDAR
jgi:hypothetical protein